MTFTDFYFNFYYYHIYFSPDSQKCIKSVISGVDNNFNLRSHWGFWNDSWARHKPTLANFNNYGSLSNVIHP